MWGRASSRQWLRLPAVILLSLVSLFAFQRSTEATITYRIVTRVTDILVASAPPAPGSIALISDCGPGESPPSCGAPAARWSMPDRPVQLCTVETGRPDWLSVSQFQQIVAASAASWNRAEAPLGIRYTGDCALGSTVLSGDGRNEIGFQPGTVVAGGEAAATDMLTSWTPGNNPQVRTIDEADIRIPSGFPMLPACLQHTLVHEMGHVAGLGHSTDPNDVMYPVIDFGDPANCKLGPSDAERARLQDVYGTNLAPSVVGGSEQAKPGDTVTLHVNASDPEGDPLTYSWRQTSGPPVVLSTATSQAPTFVAPPADSLDFSVTVMDTYLHQTTATVSVVEASRISAGALPASGFGLFVFAGGSTAQLLAASGCPASTAAFWVTDGNGNFVIWLPGTTVGAVNQPWLAMFPTGLPSNVPVLGRCSA